VAVLVIAVFFIPVFIVAIIAFGALSLDICF
jgi:hypothetical protein